jgi:hypothetical protein
MQKFNLTSEDKIYIAGFLDGDGCINAQIVPRRDYDTKFQIRVSVTFYQRTKRKWILQWLQKRLKCGVIRDRNDGNMSDYTITGATQVKQLLLELKPWIKLKKPQTRLLLKIIEHLLPTAPKDPQAFLTLCEMVDPFEQLNDSKKRKYTSDTVRSVLFGNG